MAPKSKQIKGISALLFQAGLSTAMLIAIVAFEWKFEDPGAMVDTNSITEDLEELMDIPVTEQPPPPPPKIQQPKIMEVPDEEEIIEDLEIEMDIEVEVEEEVEEFVVETDHMEEETDEIFTIVEDKAGPVGGDAAFYKYIGDHLKYPRQAVALGVEGRVFVQFVVERDGTLTDVQAIKGIGAGCDAEAIRIVSGAPKWNPAKQRGRPVRSRVIVPIIFKLH